MKPATRLALIIAGAIVLYAVALGVGLTLNGRSEGPGLGEIGDGWQGALGKLGEWFAPRLELGPPIDCNGQPVDRLFTLTAANDACVLRFSGSDDVDYRKGELALVRTPATAALGMYVRGRFEERYFPRAERDDATCLVDDDRLQPFRLEIRYEPNDSDGDDTWACWLVHDLAQPFTLTVLKDGGDLSLRCVGCDAGEGREVLLRMR